MSPDTISAIRDLGAFGLLVFVVIGGMRGLYVWRWSHEEVIRLLLQRAEAAEKREAEWKSLARLSGASTDKLINNLAQKGE